MISQFMPAQELSYHVHVEACFLTNKKTRFDYQSVWEKKNPLKQQQKIYKP